jgi:hypothetical protein
MPTRGRRAGATLKALVLMVTMAGGAGSFSHAMAQSASSDAVPIEAVTASGERVRLFGNGRWEYLDERKAEVQRQAASAEIARERSSQGGFFGIGRRIQEGDKDYNRGTLNPKMR